MSTIYTSTDREGNKIEIKSSSGEEAFGKDGKDPLKEIEKLKEKIQAMQKQIDEINGWRTV